MGPLHLCVCWVSTASGVGDVHVGGARRRLVGATQVDHQQLGGAATHTHTHRRTVRVNTTTATAAVALSTAGRCVAHSLHDQRDPHVDGDVGADGNLVDVATGPATTEPHKHKTHNHKTTHSEPAGN